MWADSDPDDTTYLAVITASLRQAQNWRSQYEHAKTLAAQTRLTTCGPRFGNWHSGMRRGRKRTWNHTN